MLNQPIARIAEPCWEAILQMPITESHDSIIKIEATDRIKIKPVYYQDNIDGALPDIWLRSQVITRLQQVVDYLPKEFGLLILDGWRPYQVQLSLRKLIGQDIKKHHPQFTDKEYISYLNQFVAMPSTDPSSPSPHITGGSVDLTLINLTTGQAEDMGAPFDSPELDSWTAAFEQEDKDPDVRMRRRMLANAMFKAGFTNLPTEWWHFDYGNQLWAYYSQQLSALYTVVGVAE